MITQAQNTTPPIDNRNWLGEPYAERRVLAGFLNRGELEFVDPHSNEWPSEVRERVAALHGAAHLLNPRADAGLCDIWNVEEPEALDVLGVAGRAIEAPIVASFSYSWVNIHNLIAVRAIADPFPPPVPLSNDDLRSLAEYSLYENIGQPLFVSPTTLATTGPVNLIALPATLKNGQLVVRYQLSKVVRPIIVGYEENRCYLLKEYGRVLAAMAQGIDRLLCLVYYGLNLTQADFQVAGLHAQGLLNAGEPINHFGASRLAINTPLVRDFLDSALTATFPCRSSVFLLQPTVQTSGMQFEFRAPGPLPLSGCVIDSTNTTSRNPSSD